jgi:hypothetical protein
VKFSRAMTAKIVAQAGGPVPKPLICPTRLKTPAAFAPPDWLVRFVAPLQTWSLTNQRDAHWRDRHRRAKDERAMTRLVINALGLGTPNLQPPFAAFAVTLTRLGGQKLDDDNLRGALKSVRDEVADWLRVCDGDEAAAAWSYDQKPGGLWGVAVEVRPKAWR